MEPTVQPSPQMPTPGMPSVSDAMPGQGMPGQGMASEDQKRQLMDLIEATRSKIGETNAAHFAAKNSSEQARNDALKEVFSILQTSGVDLTDPASVSNFIEQVRAKNPELAQMLEEALNSLLGGDTSPAPSGEIPQPVQPPPPQDIMNTQNETSPQDIRGHIPPPPTGQFG